MKTSVCRMTITIGVVSILVGGSVPCLGAPSEWVQWSGNGHWYKPVPGFTGLTWDMANELAQAQGAHLVTITSADENAFVFGLVVNDPQYWRLNVNYSGPALGGLQDQGAAEPAGGWHWVTGEPWTYSNWYPGQPDNWTYYPWPMFGEDRLHFFGPYGRWNDLPHDDLNLGGYIMEKEEPENLAPTAEAGANVVINSADQSLTTIQGAADDSDGDPLQYRWLEGDAALTAWAPVVNGAAPLNLGSIPALPLGDHVLTLEASDGTATGCDTMTLTLLNTPPVAVLNPASLAIEIGSAFTIKATAADFDGDLLTYQWVKGSEVLGSGVVTAPNDGSPIAIADLVVSANDPPFDLGAHSINLVLHDPVNGPITATATVTVKDSTLPTLRPVSSESILWPPDHALRPVTIQANASDNGGSVTLAATVCSNEPQEDGGDGSTDQDWTTPVIDNLTGTIDVSLRAERSGSGGGRVYTITITATDQSGNASVATVEVRVPHDRKNR